MPAPRAACLSPADFYGMASSFTGLYVPDVAKTALEKSKLPMVGNTDCYASQNVINSTVGFFAGTPVISATASANGITNTGVTTYQASMNTTKRQSWSMD